MGMPAEEIEYTPEAEYHDDFWHVNPGDEKIHATRIRGRFRTYKWMTASLWLLYFFGPYLRWNGRQAVLFDIPHRKFHLFSITVWPQDVWMLSLVLIFLALALFAVTAAAGRIFCGYLCFQTVWTDLFTFIEERTEGPPNRRRQLDMDTWTFNKVRIKVIKHTLWLIIAVLTGVTFAAYFSDAFRLWRAYLTLDAPAAAWVTVGLFITGTYVFAGFMREQVCFWLCPYARIQGVMYDRGTILPTYDGSRGEPRSRIKRGIRDDSTGDCIDCNLCVAVCPTGIDIRHGQQEGCITCGLCIDACDSIMEKVGRPRGLIKYASLDEMEGMRQPPLYRRPRVIVYSLILLAAFSGILYGLLNLNGIDLKVIHERQPLFVRLSDGSIQNRYTLKIVNRMETDLKIRVTVDGPEGVVLSGVSGDASLPLDRVTPFTVFVKMPGSAIDEEITPLTFRVANVDDQDVWSEYESMFVAPKNI